MADFPKNHCITAFGPDDDVGDNVVTSHSLVVDKTGNFINYLESKGVVFPDNTVSRMKLLPKALVFGSICTWIKTLQGAGTARMLSKVVAARDLKLLIELVTANDKLMAELGDDDDANFLIHANTFDTWRPGQHDKFWSYLDMYIELCAPGEIFTYND